MLIYKKNETKYKIIFYHKQITIMTPRLTPEFKDQATKMMLDTSKQLILTRFDKNNKCKETIKINSDTTTIEITRCCFPEDTANKKRYFEDYIVYFVTIIQNEKVFSKFYLEWEKNDMNKELFSSKKIQIKKYKN